MTTKKQTVPVSERALVQRINRKLKADNEVAKAARGDKAVQQLGRYYVLDLRMNAIIHKDIDLAQFGRKVGALADFEHLVEE